MADFKQYDPARVVMTYRGIPIRGYMDGTFISVERASDSFEKAVGAGGDVARVRSRDRSGRVTLTLQQTAPVNDLLSAIAIEDELFGTGLGPLMVKDVNGTTLLLASIAWIVRPANVEFGDSLSGREWIFDCADLNMGVGGSVL